MEVTDEQFRVLVESVEDYAIYLLDPQGVIRSWNIGAERLKGYKAADIIGQNFSRFFTEADRKAGKPQELLAQALARRTVEDLGWRVRMDGSQFWASAILTALFDASGKHVGFAKVSRDLTERGYRAFVEASNTIVWTTDANGHPNADSPSWRAFTADRRTVARPARLGAGASRGRRGATRDVACREGGADHLRSRVPHAALRR